MQVYCYILGRLHQKDRTQSTDPSRSNDTGVETYSRCEVPVVGYAATITDIQKINIPKHTDITSNFFMTNLLVRWFMMFLTVQEGCCNG